MAKKKENLPIEENLTERDTIENIVADETSPLQEEVVETEQLIAYDKPSFGQKLKSFFAKIGKKVRGAFVSLWQKIKGAFEKDKSLQNDEELQRILRETPAEMLSGTQLSRGERVKRFLQSQSGWLFVLPAVILMCVFTFYPIVSAFINAFQNDYRGSTGAFNGWGFENFMHVFQGDTGTGGANFVQCLVNTLTFTFVSVPISTLLALLIAVALNSIKPLQKAYQTVLFLPYLTNALAMGAVFATFFNVIGTPAKIDSYGIVNNLLQALGLQDPDNPLYWISSKAPKWVISENLSIPWTKYIVVILYEIWSGLPFKILILFSALQSVNKQYYDAAKVDGASKSTILWKITAPMISPMISYLLITGIMGGMKQYSAVVGIFGAEMGTNYDMGTMVGYVYKYIGKDQTGLAAAGSLVLFAIIMVITIINLSVSKKRVTY